MTYSGNGVSGESGEKSQALSRNCHDISIGGKENLPRSPQKPHFQEKSDAQSIRCVVGRKRPRGESVSSETQYIAPSTVKTSPSWSRSGPEDRPNHPAPADALTPPTSESEERFGRALARMDGGWSMSAAARSEGFDPSNFRRRIIRIRGRSPDTEQAFRAADDRILAIAQELSESAGAALIEKVDDGDLKVPELTKLFTGATNTVSQKRRWNQGIDTGNGRTQDALAGALEELRKGSQIQITPSDPADQALDVTPTSTPPSDEAGKPSDVDPGRRNVNREDGTRGYGYENH